MHSKHAMEPIVLVCACLAFSVSGAPALFAEQPKPVTVVNEPTVDARQAGAWSVDVNSSPGNPLYVRSLNEAGRSPFQVVFRASPGPNTGCGLNFCSFNLPAIPDGQRLVLTDFRAHLALKPAAQPGRLTLSDDDGSFFEIEHRDGACFADTLSIGAPRRCTYNEELLHYLPGGSQVNLFFYSLGGDLDPSWPQTFVVVGYLADDDPLLDVGLIGPDESAKAPEARGAIPRLETIPPPR